MAEIERKFLVAEMPRAEQGSTAIEQGYLALDERGEVRLRRADDALLLTAKTGHGEVREEVEVPLERGAFESLWPLTAGRRLRKVRHRVPLGDGLCAELDVYEGALAGLRTAEVEFRSREEAERFTPPAWLGAELTGDDRYANQRLATAGPPSDGGWLSFASHRATKDSHPLPNAGEKRDDVSMHQAYRLLEDEPAAAGVRRVVAARLDKAADRLRGGADDDGGGGGGESLSEAIHGARKDLKRVRAALRLVRAELGEPTFKRENRALRDAGRLLSASRDAAVLPATLDSLCEGGGAPPGPTLIWRETLVAHRERVVGEGEEVDAAAAAIEAVAARVPEWELDRDGWELLGPGLDTAYREGRAAFAALRAEPGFEAVHELRKRGKDLWYQLRLLHGAWPPLLDATAEEAHAFTDLLGDHHDLAVLARDLAVRIEVGASGRDELRGLIEARQAGLLADAVVKAERLYAEKPKAFRRRLRSYWRAWRGEG